jgi:hypothetical protein
MGGGMALNAADWPVNSPFTTAHFVLPAAG